MHQVQVDRVEPESVQTGLQRGFDPFGSMVVVPQLCRHEQVLAADDSVSEQVVERCADLRFVAVPFGTVQVAEPHLDRGLRGISCLCSIRDKRSKSERRNLTVAIVQRKSALMQVLTRCHVDRSPSWS
jgi:hypothetical protein